jgi:hypothetical protein
MLTPEGAKWMADWIVERLLAGSWIVVSDGAGESAVATISEARTEEDADGDYQVVATATFDENSANFEWKKRSVKLADGTVIDSDEEDAGRKVEGAVWTYDVTIEVAGEDEGE